MKLRHDKNRKAWTPVKNDIVFLNLGQGYNIRDRTGKFQLRRVGPFKILRITLSSNAAQLKLPAKWGIHNVINIKQLEPAPRSTSTPNRGTSGRHATRMGYQISY